MINHQQVRLYLERYGAGLEQWPVTDQTMLKQLIENSPDLLKEKARFEKLDNELAELLTSTEAIFPREREEQLTKSIVALSKNKEKSEEDLALSWWKEGMQWLTQLVSSKPVYTFSSALASLFLVVFLLNDNPIRQETTTESVAELEEWLIFEELAGYSGQIEAMDLQEIALESPEEREDFFDENLSLFL